MGIHNSGNGMPVGILSGCICCDRRIHVRYTISPRGKTGGYNLLGLAGALIRRIEGDMYNVIGLPLHRLTTLLAAKVASQS